MFGLINNKPDDRHLALYQACSKTGLTIQDYKYLISGSSHIVDKHSIDVDDLLDRYMRGNHFYSIHDQNSNQDVYYL